MCSSDRSSYCSSCCKSRGRGLCDSYRMDEKLPPRTNTVQDTNSVTNAHVLTYTDADADTVAVAVADTNTFRECVLDASANGDALEHLRTHTNTVAICTTSAAIDTATWGQLSHNAGTLSRSG